MCSVELENGPTPRFSNLYSNCTTSTLRVAYKSSLYNNSQLLSGAFDTFIHTRITVTKEGFHLEVTRHR